MRKLITVGSDPFPPYQYYDESGSVKGSDYDLVKKAFDLAGYDIKVVLDEWKKIEGDLINKVIDAAFQVQHTPEREKKYHFSNLLRNAVTEVVTGNKDLVLNSFKEMEDKKLSIGVINNYTYGDDIDSLDSSLKISYPDQISLLKAINDKVVDVGIFDKGVKEYLMESAGLNNIHSIKALEFIRPLYVVFSNPALRDEFNIGLAKL
jgi:ABC-type amino acid transport substrate-binding protein